MTLSFLHCPRCGFVGVTTRNHARRTFSSVGTVVGAAGGAAAALVGGVEAGAALGVLAGPPGVIVGSLVGAIMGALFGGATGCATGAVLGETIDANVLDNHQCDRCGHAFSRSQPRPYPPGVLGSANDEP